MIYRSLTQLISVLLIALGVTMLVVTLWHGVGVGLVLGALFVVAGAGRLYVLRRREP
jgi:uncharacterized membrane protein HdeD (DUF308 family)